MEAALKLSSHAECMLYSGHLQNEEAAALEKGSVVVEEGFLDELFDFEWLPEEAEEEDTLLEMKEEQGLDSPPELAKRGHSHSNSGSSSSALSFEPPPPPSELSLPVDDVAELEWVSHFVDESFSDYPPPCSVEPLINPLPKPQPPTAVVLAVAPIPVKARRSKRARAAGWVRPALSEPSSCSSSCSMSCSSSSSNLLIWGSAMPPLLLAEQQKHKKKRGRKPKSHSAAHAAEASVGGERRCSHCGAQKTPQWRTGPEGAKTLCNACGVRYKSGRLLPEYRPACSPTFSALAHSNSHRKVLEMRRKKAEPAGAAADDDNEPQLILSSSAPPVPSC